MHFSMLLSYHMFVFNFLNPNFLTKHFTIKKKVTSKKLIILKLLTYQSCINLNVSIIYFEITY